MILIQFCIGIRQILLFMYSKKKGHSEMCVFRCCLYKTSAICFETFITQTTDHRDLWMLWFLDMILIVSSPVFYRFTRMSPERFQHNISLGR